MSHPRPSWVCTTCQIANKGGGKCPTCTAPMECIGHSWRAPKRGDKRGWKLIGQLIAKKRRSGLANDCSPSHSSSDPFDPYDYKSRPKSAEELYRESTYKKEREKRYTKLLRDRAVKK